MRYDETRCLLLFENTCPERLLCFYIEGRGEVVEDKEISVANEHSSGGGTLNLSSRQFDTTRPNDGVESLLQRWNIIFHNASMDGVFDRVTIVG